MATRTLLAGGLCVLVLGACTNGPVSGDRAGVPSSPLRVSMADSQPADAPSSLAMKAFADQVEEISDSEIQVVITSGGVYADDSGDAKVVSALIAGDIQLAVVPSRAWSDAGAASTNVLQAPFEIAGPRHFAAIADDDELVTEALADLDGLGVHGLTVFPERLRYLTSFGEPFLEPQDLQGVTLRSISSSVGSILEALGATVVNPNDDQFAAMRRDGTIDGTETDLERAVGIAAGSTVTIDRVFYGKFDTLAANANWWETLTTQQQGTFVAAADTIRDREVERQAAATGAALAFCDAGGRLAMSGTARSQAFRDALAQYTSELDQQLLARLREADEGADVSDALACTPAPSGLDPTSVRAEGGALPNGTYRFRYTEELARRFNAKYPDGILFEGEDAPGSWTNLTFTWVLDDGHFDFEIQRDSEPPFTSQGIYQVQGDQMLIELNPDIGNSVNRLQWEVTDDGSLLLTQVDALKRDYFYWLPWTLIDQS